MAFGREKREGPCLVDPGGVEEVDAQLEALGDGAQRLRLRGLTVKCSTTGHALQFGYGLFQISTWKTLTHLNDGGAAHHASKALSRGNKPLVSDLSLRYDGHFKLSYEY